MLACERARGVPMAADFQRFFRESAEAERTYEGGSRKTKQLYTGVIKNANETFHSNKLTRKLYPLRNEVGSFFVHILEHIFTRKVGLYCAPSLIPPNIERVCH